MPPVRTSAVSWRAVRFDDPFWAPRQCTVRERTLPALHKQLQTSGRLDALRLQWQPGMRPVPHQFWDSDVAKWLEAASYSLATHPDAELESKVDAAIDLLRGAQQPDGYLNSYITSVDLASRWTDLRDGHELYCAGHLIEAGVAHYLATGRRSLLDIVCRYADYIASVFGRGQDQKRGYCGHPEIELALVRLFRATGERRFLDLSAYFVDERGCEPYYFDLEAAARGGKPRASDAYYRRNGLRGMALRRYNQSHAPVREQHEVVGHAVRAMYLYSAMADLARELDDGELLAACERLWSHLIGKRLYVTGGIGSSHRNEGFSVDYDLPNADAYAETCAAIGLVGWAHRMLLLTGDSRYADVLELALYNGIAAAFGADGEHFFYANPLASQGATHRQPWFRVACCPPNVARLLTSLGQYVYSVGDGVVMTHLYVQGAAEFSLGDRTVRIRQQHDYPWAGAIQLALELEAPRPFTLYLRVPGWARSAGVRVNGVESEGLRHVGGYVELQRTWESGDCVELEMPMPVERVYAHPAVAENAGRVSLQRGPLIYCVEGADNDLPLHALSLPRTAPLETRFDRDLLGGVVALQAQALANDPTAWDGRLYRSGGPGEGREHNLVAVPYAVWDNRAPGPMQVWIREH